MQEHSTPLAPSGEGNLKLAGKIGILVILVVILLIGLSWVQSLVDERQNAQTEVIQQIAASSSNSQTILGPVLVIPYQYSMTENVYAKDDAGNTIGKVIGSREVIQHKEWLVLPKDLKVDGNAKVEARRLGIYQGQVYLSDLNISGSFPALDSSHLNALNKLSLGEPRLTVLVGDTRGIQTLSAFKLDNDSFEFQAGSGLKISQAAQAPVAAEVAAQYHENGEIISPAMEVSTGSDLSNGVHVVFADKNHWAAWDKAQKFSFNLKIQGTESLAMVPVGENSSLSLHSNWADPNFAEQLSPSSRDITPQGFKATWNSTWFANNLNTKLQSVDDLAKSEPAAFGVRFVKTVNEYQLNTRSVKYGILFIVLTFIAFFVTEILKSLRVHPIQYFMIGGTLVLFYVLLLSLSEHLGFALSYIIAAMMCVGLITMYAVFALKDKKTAFTMGALLAIVYAVLYLILQSEDFALLSGSLLLFVVLGIIMFVTRNVNWYKDVTLGLDTSSVDNDNWDAFIDIPAFEPSKDSKTDITEVHQQDKTNDTKDTDLK